MFRRFDTKNTVEQSNFLLEKVSMKIDKISLTEITYNTYTTLDKCFTAFVLYVLHKLCKLEKLNQFYISKCLNWRHFEFENKRENDLFKEIRTICGNISASADAVVVICILSS